jgi:hypothetical protein
MKDSPPNENSFPNPSAVGVDQLDCDRPGASNQQTGCRGLHRRIDKCRAEILPRSPGSLTVSPNMKTLSQTLHLFLLRILITDLGLMLAGPVAAQTDGGNSGNGTVFAVNTDGTGFTTLHGFTADSGSRGSVTNIDGAIPWGALALSGNTLYGTTVDGGIWATAQRSVFRSRRK